MGSDEHDILEFLKKFDTFVSPTEVAKRVGGKRRFREDRDWARPILHRMLMEELLEANEYGHVRMKSQSRAKKKDEKVNYYALGRRTYVLSDDEPFSSALTFFRNGK
jgi:hypothetical protein